MEISKLDRKQSYVGNTIKVFISYANEDKESASCVKDFLEKYGIEVFLAHEDINPTEKWEGIILRKLDACDIFMPLLTENFKKSDWTNQETGIALAKNKWIIPIKIEIDPYGFIWKIQALKLNNSEIEKCYPKILDVICNNKNFTESLKDCLIKGFVNSSSFKSAEILAEELDKFDFFKPEQIREIFRGSIYPEFDTPQVFSLAFENRNR